MTNALQDMHNAVDMMRQRHAERRDMDEEVIEKYLALLDKAAGVLNDQGLIEDQWALQGFASGLIGIKSEDNAKDPTYGNSYLRGYMAAKEIDD